MLPVVAVAVMDRDSWGANTDNLAVVDPHRRSVVSVPRDLWCTSVGDRINRAWAEGGAPRLIAALPDRLECCAIRFSDYTRSVTEHT
jgi:anionic cell wall polymer biosynthesis LytR-Cps2A-Psr (LCP) family protein